MLAGLLLAQPLLPTPLHAQEPLSTVPPCPLEAQGYFSASLRGTLDADLDWHGAALACDGMPRPDGSGGRLLFGGEFDDGTGLSLVLGIESLAPGRTGEALPVNITLVVRDRGQFFGSRQQSGCWADIRENRPLEGRPDRFRIAGVAWCVRVLPEIGGDGAVSLPSAEFAGVLSLEDSIAD